MHKRFVVENRSGQLLKSTSSEALLLRAQIARFIWGIEKRIDLRDLLRIYGNELGEPLAQAPISTSPQRLDSETPPCHSSHARQNRLTLPQWVRGILKRIHNRLPNTPPLSTSLGRTYII